MQRSWWHAAVLIAPWGLTGPFTQSREALHALEGTSSSVHNQWPGRLVGGRTWLVDLVALRAVLVGNW